MKRRDVLKSGAWGTAAIALANCTSQTSLDSSGEDVTRDLLPVDIYIPGYMPAKAHYKGQPVLEHPRMRRSIPTGYNGSISMLTKFGTDGSISQSLFPVRGHDIAFSPDGKTGVFGSMERQTYVAFDPLSLDLVAMGKPFKSNWIGGGHAAYLANDTVALAERAPKLPYTGTPEDHFGRITLRDPNTLKILGDFSAHGISPHEVRILEDGKHSAIANYGSVIPPGGGRDYGVPRHIVEPSITIVEISSGKLVEKYHGSKNRELRHLCAKDAQTIFAIQTELGVNGADQKYFKRSNQAYTDELNGAHDPSYLIAPAVRTRPKSKRLASLGSLKLQQLMRHGLSIEYDRTHDEVIATYPATHSILVFDAQSGSVKHHIDGSKIGLDYPCGITMLPTQMFYVVAGYWKNLYVFERGSHKLRRELSHYPITFGHSHIAAI